MYSHGSLLTSIAPPTLYVGNTLYDAYDGPLTHGLFIVDARSCESPNWHQCGSKASTVFHLALRANRGTLFGSFSETLAISLDHRSVWPKVPLSTGTWSYDRYSQTGSGCNSLPSAAACRSSSTPRQSVHFDFVLRFPSSSIRSCRHLLTHLEWWLMSDTVAGTVQESEAALLLLQRSTGPARRASCAPFQTVMVGFADAFFSICIRPCR